MEKNKLISICVRGIKLQDPQIIAPGHTVEVQFTFAPREAQEYCEIVEFELNGLSRQKVEICGTGTELKVRHELTSVLDSLFAFTLFFCCCFCW